MLKKDKNILINDKKRDIIYLKLVEVIMKKYISALISFFIGVGCMVTYSIIGSEVAADGTLIEPFFLIPLGYLFIGISVIIAIIVCTISFTKKKFINR